MLFVCTKGLRITQFQFSVCTYSTYGRIDNKADFDFLTMGCHIPISPSICLRCDRSIINLENINSQLLLVALAIAKKTFLMNCKSRNSTHIASWKNLILDYISMGNLSSSSHNTVIIIPLLVISHYLPAVINLLIFFV